MGFYFRKSSKLGPFRINYSKSGVGVSFGVRGARISTGPRGTYIHAGANGFYYRERLGAKRRNGKQNINNQPIDSSFSGKTYYENDDIFNIVDSETETLVKEINKKLSRISIGLLIYISSLILTVLSYYYLKWDNIITLCIFAAGSVISIIIAIIEKLKKKTRLYYELDEVALNRYSYLEKALIELSNSNRIWQIKTRTEIYDQKRNSGATSSVSRVQACIKHCKAPYLDSNILPYSIQCENCALYFFPDQLFVYQKKRYGIIKYNSLSILTDDIYFHEKDYVPRDAVIVKYTWKYVNKNGSRDLRFNNNFKIPVCNYGVLKINSNNGLNIYLHVSNINCISNLAMYFKQGTFVSDLETSKNTHEESDYSSYDRNMPNDIYEAFKVLDLNYPASYEEIKEKYYKLIKMYHPDMTLHLTGSIKKMADNRMVDINIAYEKINNFFQNKV